jgi:hypothetical protein
MIDFTKRLQTRDGREVRIYACDGGGSHPIHGAIKEEHEWSQMNWKECGSFANDAGDHPFDLVNVKTMKSGWVVLYPRESDGQIRVSAFVHPTEKNARDSFPNAVSVLQAEWEE